MQTKIGFDKIPVPSIVTTVPLNDILTGEALVDEGGTRLVTETNAAVAEIARSDKATSAVLDPATITPIPIEEVFRETSETSTTLLGIDRAEVQLSLFADVSVLGLDEKDWEVFNFTNYLGYGPWESRGTKSFGNHYNARMREETQEQAIQIGAFPVPYTYPWPERFSDQGLYNSTLYSQFINFMNLGNILYTYYSESGRQQDYGSDFKDKFLDPSKVFINQDNEIEYTGVTEAEGLVLIDEWTRTWVDIISNRLLDPRNNIDLITPGQINAITGGSPAIGDTRPGYRTNDIRYSLLQSRKAYRYQPGRISGFTFGAKASTDSGSNANIIEWGISNPTDQYVFQIQGANFSIVRRSTVPLEASVLIRNGLDAATGQTLQPSGDPFDVDPATGQLREYFTSVIPREKFNGDPVNGNGPSGYLLNPSLVTMFKIEFGWYGAIGARFYAYVPVDNGEGRWIVLHTLVIENSLGKPCLEDPFFKFIYRVRINDAATLRTPQFLYKYGASMYIDGGDEGTVTQHSYTSPVRNINANFSKSLLGVYAKPEIVNIEGVSKVNKKVIIPKDLAVSSDVLSKVEILRCRACPGFGFNYNEGLKTDTNGRELNFRFITPTRNKIEALPSDPFDPDPAELFQLTDVDAKLITDGIWSTYIDSIDLESAVIVNDEVIGYEEAFLGRITSGYTKVGNTGLPAQVFSRTQNQLITIPIGTQYPYPVRLSNYDAIAGSDVALTGSTIQIQLLNPLSISSSGHFNEFVLGVTDKKPIEVLEEGDLKLKWDYGSGDERDVLEEADTLIGEWTQSTTSRNRNGFERGESNYPREHKMELDFRLPNPPGVGSGRCSALTVRVLDKVNFNTTLVFGNPATEEEDGEWYLRLQPNVQFPSGTLINGEIGVGGEGTGIVFTSEQQSFQSGVDRIYFVRISGQLPNVDAGSTVQIQLTPVSITGRHINQNKIFKFNPYPLYLFAKLRDGARINSISVAESIGDTTVSSSPKWILNSNIETDTYNGLAVSQLPPVNFVSEERLDAAAVDTQLEQRLRPTTTIDTFFVGENQTARISLENIYGIDRESITTDLFNIEATFFAGTVVPIPGEPTTGTIQITLNTSEQ